MRLARERPQAAGPVRRQEVDQADVHERDQAETHRPRDPPVGRPAEEAHDGAGERDLGRGRGRERTQSPDPDHADTEGDEHEDLGDDRRPARPEIRVLGDQHEVQPDVHHDADEHRGRIQLVALDRDEGGEREQREEVDALADHEQSGRVGGHPVLLLGGEHDQRLGVDDEADARADRGDRAGSRRRGGTPPEPREVRRPRLHHQRERGSHHCERDRADEVGELVADVVDAGRARRRHDRQHQDVDAEVDRVERRTQRERRRFLQPVAPPRRLEADADALAAPEREQDPAHDHDRVEHRGERRTRRWSRHPRSSARRSSPTRRPGRGRWRARRRAARAGPRTAGSVRTRRRG